MLIQPSNDDLERYLAGKLSSSATKRIEKAVKRSAELRARLDELRFEHKTVEAIKDSFGIRLPEAEEERIVSKAVDRLRTELSAVRPD